MRIHTVVVVLGCLGAQQAGAQSTTPPSIRMPEPIVRQMLKGASADEPAREARIFHDTLPPAAVTPWHTHDSSPIYYIVRGGFTLDFKDRPSVVVRAGEGFVEPVGVALRGRSALDMPTEFVIVQVSDPTKPFLRMTAP